MTLSETSAHASGPEPKDDYKGLDPLGQIHRFLHCLNFKGGDLFCVAVRPQENEPFRYREARIKEKDGIAVSFEHRHGFLTGKLKEKHLRGEEISPTGWASANTLRKDFWKGDKYIATSEFSGLEGGADNDHVRKVRCWHCEGDKPAGDRHEQVERVLELESLGVVPSAVVDSGHKSLHCFFPKPEGELTDWETDRRIMQKLAVLVKGDTKVIQPKQLMRIPGFNRLDGEPVQMLWGRVGPQYSSAAEFEARLDEALVADGVDDWQATFELMVAAETNRTASDRARSGELAQQWAQWAEDGGWSDGERRAAALCQPVAVEEFVQKRAAELLKSGSSNGCRNDDGLMLTLALAGAERVLAQLGLKLAEPVEVVLDRYADASGDDFDRERLDQQLEGARNAEAWPSRTVAEFMRSLHYNTDGALGEPKDRAPAGDVALADEECPFTVLGWTHQRESLAYQIRANGQIGFVKGFSSTELMRLASKDWWGVNFPPPGNAPGVAWQEAQDNLMRSADKRQIFDPTFMRDQGVWTDKGRVVWHLGDRLDVDGEIQSIADFDGAAQYQLSPVLGIDPAGEVMGDAEGTELLAAIEAMGWERPFDGLHLAGWIVSSNVGGALPKRPGLQVEGSTGKGKSYVVDEWASPLQGGLGVHVTGATEAGIRQTMGGKSLPVSIDESEQEDPRRRKGQLQYARYSFDGKLTSKGTPHGKPMQFLVRSSVCLMGINTPIPNAADANRIIVVRRRYLPDGAFQKLEQRRGEVVTHEAGERLVRRCVRHLHAYLANIDTFGAVIARRYGGRAGDCFAPILAGAHLLTSTAALDQAQAEQWIDRKGWCREVEELEKVSAVSEAQACLEHLLSFEVRVSGSADTTNTGVITIREICGHFLNPPKENTFPHEFQPVDPHKAILTRLGMKMDRERGLVIATGQRKPEKVFAGTKWENGAFVDRLQDLEGVDQVPSPPKFPVDPEAETPKEQRGYTSRAIAVPAALLGL